MAFKDEIIGAIGNQFLGAILGALNKTLSATAGKAFARTAYKTIAAPGDPKKVQADNETRAKAVEVTGAAFRAAVGAGLDRYTTAQAAYERVRGTEAAAAALALREAAEKELEAVFADPLGLKGA